MSRKFVQFFFWKKKHFFPNVKVLRGLYFLSLYPVNCCRSGLSFMRFEVVFAMNIYISIYSVTTVCNLFVGMDISDESTDCIFMVEP